MLKLKTCPTCGSRRVRQVREDVTFNIRGRRHIVRDLQFIRCDACGEKLFDLEASRKIDASILTPTRAAQRRKSA